MRIVRSVSLLLSVVLFFSGCSMFKHDGDSGGLPTSPSEILKPGTSPNIVMGTEFRRRPDWSQSGVTMHNVIQLVIIGEATGGLEDKLDQSNPRDPETIKALFVRNFNVKCGTGPTNWVPQDTESDPYDNGNPTPYTNRTVFRDIATCGDINLQLGAVTNRGRRIWHKLDHTNITFDGGSGVKIDDSDGHNRYRSSKLPTVPA